ncbi:MULTISPECIES: sensor histidine kinase [unclassified Rummeliibacillus]|uniref:sensor histidine kinase n=1 Tax=unclassified Rummeliibacillus TaxID=2622809 RepID=UPI000E672EEF|nr:MULTISPECIES: sensor histidine kinase [unclassified Rummeliibacillus]RIJ69590.1 sensor histidine kinase [Rummeliibacillus sp. POC4]RPJ96043.1 sensor histidine kinase [Rummeliibacillus sp. TYF005]
MTKFLTRTLTTLFFELILLTAIFFLLYGNTLSKWEGLWVSRYWNLPIVVLFISLCLLFSVCIATWSLLLTHQKEQQFELALQNAVKNDNQSLETFEINASLQKSLTSTKELISTQRKSLQKMTNDKAVNQDLIIQERIVQERQRLARELHDSVSQQLFAASMLLSTVNETVSADLSDDTKRTLLQTEQIVQQAQLEMRALLLHLRPAALKDKSISKGLEDLLIELQQKVTFTIKYRLEDVHLSKGAEDHLFRIAQETLSNTLRHAKATELELLLVERNERVIFRVRDNGIGFETIDEKAGSYGLHNIEERAVEIGGTCKIVSVPSQGTVIEIQIPVEKELLKNDSNSIS